MKASIRAMVEQPFRIIKRRYRFVKARYKGLRKNDNHLAMLFTLANLFRVDQMGKPRQKICNWKQYNQDLVHRGSLTVWMDQ